MHKQKCHSYLKSIYSLLNLDERPSCTCVRSKYFLLCKEEGIYFLVMVSSPFSLQPTEKTCCSQILRRGAWGGGEAVGGVGLTVLRNPDFGLPRTIMWLICPDYPGKHFFCYEVITACWYSWEKPRQTHPNIFQSILHEGMHQLRKKVERGKEYPTPER